MTTLYHSSPSGIDEILPIGSQHYAIVDFGGVFADSDREVAASHHSVMHVITLDDARILTESAMQYDVEYSRVLALVASSVGDELAERVADSIIPAECLPIDDDLMFDLGCADAGELGWRLQALRGTVAAGLGYHAVEMSDEHGVTHLVLPGAEIEIESDIL